MSCLQPFHSKLLPYSALHAKNNQYFLPTPCYNGPKYSSKLVNKFFEKSHVCLRRVTNPFMMSNRGVSMFIWCAMLGPRHPNRSLTVSRRKTIITSHSPLEALRAQTSANYKLFSPQMGWNDLCRSRMTGTHPAGARFAFTIQGSTQVSTMGPSMGYSLPTPGHNWTGQANQEHHIALWRG